MRLRNKTAIVTGAASGYGAGIAARFAEEGAEVIVADIDEAKGRKITASIVEAGGQAQFVKVDVSKCHQCKEPVLNDASFITGTCIEVDGGRAV